MLGIWSFAGLSFPCSWIMTNPMSDQPVLLDVNVRFPDTGSLYTPKTPDGLCFAGGNLLPGNLLRAYRNGVFPWSANPFTWWSPEPRAIFDLDHIHIPRRLAQIIRSGKFTITYDTCFTRVIKACAASSARRTETWIAPEFIEAYSELHRIGHAHSCEVWQEKKLAGGIYGVAIGGFFAGESMFSLVDNASSVGLIHLFDSLRARGYQLFDTQVANDHTRRFGVMEISRKEYLSRLERALQTNCLFPGS